MGTWNAKANDTYPSLSTTLTDSAGAAVDVSTATITFLMRNLATGELKVSAAMGFVTDGTDGEVKYDWTTGDTDTPGIYSAEYEVTYAGGAIQTFPTVGYDRVNVHADLDTIGEETLVGLDELKKYLREPSTSDRHDETLLFALESASDKIRDYCDRKFTRDDLAATPSPSARTYRPLNPYRLYVRDFYDVTGLVVKSDQTGDGVYDTTWTVTTDYVAAPVDQRDGWPYYLIEATGGRTFPITRYPSVEVTALYGWSAVPGAVKQTCLELSADLWKRKDAPFGVLGFDDFGAVRIGNSDDRLLKRLTRYRRYPILVA